MIIKQDIYDTHFIEIFTTYETQKPYIFKLKRY